VRNKLKMDLLKRFVEYLGSQKNNISNVTVKNYRADVGQFIRWFEKTFNKPFNAKDVTPELINVYKKLRTQDISQPSQPLSLSSRSLKRHLSSLTKFLHFLKIEGVISKDPFEAISGLSKNLSSFKDKWHLNEFKDYLYIYNSAPLTIKNYIIDVEQFFVWLEEVTGISKEWNIGKKNVFEKINPILINEYKKRLLTSLSPKTINRKLSSLRKYISFAQEQNLIKTDSQYPEIKNENLKTRTYQPLSYPEHVSPSTEQNVIKYSRIPPVRLLQKTTNGIFFVVDSLLVLPLARTIEQVKYVFWKIKGKPVFKDISNNRLSKQKAKERIVNYPKSFYDPLSISTRYLPLHKKLLYHIRHNRPKWYKKYHSYSVIHYFHFAILVIFMSAMGFSIYNDFIFKPQNKGVLSAQESNQPRILAFRGRLTDSSDNPITISNTSLRMAIYNEKAASNSALLWQEVVSVNPNQDGVFETLLGNNVQIPQNIFFQNPSLWLGISIGETAELTPRQELTTVSYAVNAQTLQGLPPITSYDKEPRNVILALDSSGNLNIGGSGAPVFQATGGQLTLSGKVLLLTTIYGSESDVVINPDGLGKIDLQKPLQNTSENNNMQSALGAVEIDDLLAILATSSAQSAFTINQDSTGPLISAATSGDSKFTVENSGNIISAKGANWQPTFDSSSGLNVASSSGIPFVTFDTLHQSVGIGTVIPQASLDVLGGFRASGDITLSKFRSNAGIIYATSSGALAQVVAGTATQCLMGGETPKFANCASSPYSNINETNGKIGIGTTNPLFKLDIQDSQLATAAAQVFNTNTGTDADGLIVKLGNLSTTAIANSNHFISFETSGIGIVGSVQGNNGKGVTYATSGVADFAEYLKKDENQTIEYGSVVCIDDKGLAVPCDQTNTKIVGVASNQPAFLGGENLGNKSIAVGLVGQVYTRVSTLNGNIKPGDPLTYSNIPGVAVKATQSTYIIGKALESCVLLCGKILTLVNVSWYDPDVYLTSTGDLSIVKNSTLRLRSGQEFIIKDLLGRVVEKIVISSKAIIANLQVGFIKAEEITSEKIISPIAELDEVRTNLISPLAENIIVRLATPSGEIHNSSFIIQNSSGSAVATIDSSGNASFSGTLASQNLDVGNDATFSGTLRANRILADQIEGINIQTATLSAQYITNNYYEASSSSSELSSSLASLNNLNASFGTFSLGLMSFGPTSLAETAIAGSLSIDSTLYLAGNSINVLGNDLEIQPLRQGGISFLSGLIQIDIDGNLRVGGNAEFAKDVSIKGDLVASGSATFSKINLSLVGPALAVSQTEIIATGSAGVAEIKAHQTELTIINKLITDKSLIYISPIGSPSAHSPFMMRQTVGEPAPPARRSPDELGEGGSGPEGSFTVGIQGPTNQDTLFNWLIVN